MKRIFLIHVFSFISVAVFSQTDVVKWTGNYNASSSTIEMKAIIDEGWHLYSQYVDEDAGPVATSFEFIPNKAVSFIGKVEEPEPVKEFDQNFEAELAYFEKEVVFKQKAKANSKTSQEISVVYMVCNNQMCLPPVEKKITVSIPN